VSANGAAVPILLVILNGPKMVSHKKNVVYHGGSPD